MNNKIHTPVLLKETINMLNIKPSGIYCDFTIGYGGHASEIIKRINEANGILLGIDQDENAINYCKNYFSNYKNLFLINDNFVNFKKYFNQMKISKVDGCILDLGVSSKQLDEASRGFSFHQNGPLDMRMNQKQKISAVDYIKNNSLNELIKVFKKYGEIKNPVHIAKKIKNYVDDNENVTTFSINEIIKSNLPVKKLYEKKHPSRLFFQALRIAVNDELNVLEKFLDNFVSYLKDNGVLEVITFHSLEEKIVIKKFKSLSEPPNLLGVPLNNVELTNYELLTKKPITASKEEINQNKRSRSAKLFAIKRKAKNV